MKNHNKDKISSAIELNTLSHCSDVSLCIICNDVQWGLFKILLYELCLQLAIFVGVPTPADIIGGVALVETTISRALHNAATSSMSLYWSISSRLCIVTPSLSCTVEMSSS